MTKLCRECLDFFHILLPENSYSLYYQGVCEGCFTKTLITNPYFYLVLCEKKKNYVLDVLPEKININ